MVKELITRVGTNWQNATIALSLVIAIATFAVQLGATQTHVQINGDRISALESQIRIVEGKQFEGLATQSGYGRRLDAIEKHDIETRDLEAKLTERLGKVEARQSR